MISTRFHGRKSGCAGLVRRRKVTQSTIVRNRCVELPPIKAARGRLARRGRLNVKGGPNASVCRSREKVIRVILRRKVATTWSPDGGIHHQLMARRQGVYKERMLGQLCKGCYVPAYHRRLTATV